MPLYKIVKHLHLEYSVQFWLAHLKKDTAWIQGIQGKAMKMTRGMKQTEYTTVH